MELKQPTLNSTMTKWIWFAIIVIQFTISIFERTSYSTIFHEIRQDICHPTCNTKELGFIDSFYFLMEVFAAPFVGYFGDRFNRKYLLIIGLCIWSGCVILMTFMTDYWPFLIVNGLSTIGIMFFNMMSPAIIADLFEKKKLGWIYGLYFLGVPIGLGLALIVPRAVIELTGDWRNGLRITPGITLLNAIIIFILLADPPRADKEKNDEETAGGDKGKNNEDSNEADKGKADKQKEAPLFSFKSFMQVMYDVWSDLKYLFSIKSYLLENASIQY